MKPPKYVVPVATWLSLISVVILTPLFLLGKIEPGKYFPIAGVATFLFVVLIFIDSITEITILGNSLKRDVRAAQEIKQEVNALAKAIVEVVHGTEATTLTHGRNSETTKHLENAVEALETLAEPDSIKRQEWRKERDAKFNPSA